MTVQPTETTSHKLKLGYDNLATAVKLAMDKGRKYSYLKTEVSPLLYFGIWSFFSRYAFLAQW